MRPWVYPTLAVALLLAIAIPLGMWWQDRETNQPRSRAVVTTVGAEAFGSFTTAEKQTFESTTAGGGDASRSTATSQLTIAPDVFPVDGTRYEYVYTGELALPNLPVLRRVASTQPPAAFNSLNLFRAGSFDSLEAQYLTVTESTDDGYTISFDYQTGVVSIYRSTPAIEIQPAVKDLDTPVAEPSQVPAANLAGDPEVITAANAWLDQHGISRDGLGDPVVRPDPNVLFERLAADALLYPADATVVYPWVINDQTVYDDSGFVYGLMVAVNRSTLIVNSVNNLSVRSFEASAYELTNDTEEILAIAKRGGLYAYQPEPAEGITTVQIQLGTPATGYLVSYYQLDGTSREYLVPALIFPITSVPEGQTLYQTAVVVPLVQQLLDQAKVTGSGRGGSTEPGTVTTPPVLETE